CRSGGGDLPGTRGHTPAHGVHALAGAVRDGRGRPADARADGGGDDRAARVAGGVGGGGVVVLGGDDGGEVRGGAGPARHGARLPVRGVQGRLAGLVGGVGDDVVEGGLRGRRLDGGGRGGGLEVGGRLGLVGGLDGGRLIHEG